MVWKLSKVCLFRRFQNIHQKNATFLINSSDKFIWRMKLRDPTENKCGIELN